MGDDVICRERVGDGLAEGGWVYHWMGNGGGASHLFARPVLVHSQPALSLQVSTVPMRPAGVETMRSGGSSGGPSLGLTNAVRTSFSPEAVSRSLSAATTTCHHYTLLRFCSTQACTRLVL